jgi:hypothetical protein
MLRMTLLIYVAYILSIKSKAMFVLPMILVLFFDQVLRVQSEVLERKMERMGNVDIGLYTKWKDQQARIQQIRGICTVLIIGLIAAGAIHYYIRARRSFGAKFSNVTFFMGTKKCKNIKDTD